MYAMCTYSVIVIVIFPYRFPAFPDIFRSSNFLHCSDFLVRAFPLSSQFSSNPFIPFLVLSLLSLLSCVCLQQNIKELNIELVFLDLLVLVVCFTVLHSNTGPSSFQSYSSAFACYQQITYFDSLSEGPSWTVIGVVVGVAVFVVIMIGLVTWWVCKKKKGRKNTKK